MCESTTKMASSSLAITEKRPHSHRPGGCVGIFFKLFDWNRTFAKKKLFSKKLLPPVRAKKVSKKFVGDEKMPKTNLHLIADEKSGGFPNMKRSGGHNSVDLEKKSGMRAPGLVARLMGLDSIPDVCKNKPKKPSFAGSNDGRDEKFVNEPSGYSREELKDKVSGKIESRPQKIQKTEQFERGVVTRFGAEALQIKNVLSRSKRNYHPKLSPPMKTPRNSSARNVSRTSRLIDAATKILEPGLQATNRAKSALTYSSSAFYATKDEDFTEARKEFMSPDLSTQPTYNVGICKSLMVQTSCKNCGNILDVVDSRSNVDEQPFAYSSSTSNYSNVSSSELGKSKPISPDKEKDVAFRQRGQQISHAAVEKDNNDTRLSCVPSPDRKPSLQEGEAQWNLRRQHFKAQNEEPTSFTFKQRTQTQNQTFLCRDRMPPGAKLSNLPCRRVSSAETSVSGAKDFVALNRNLSGRTRPRVPSKVDNSSFQAERKTFNQQDDSLLQQKTPVRKRTIGVNGPVESTGFINSMLGRQRNFRGDMVTGKAKDRNSCSVDQTSIESKAACTRDSSANGNKESSVISFTFNSPVRHKTGNATDIKEIMDQNDSSSKSASYQRKVMDDNDGAPSLKRQLSLNGDVLGALLEEKLKELASQVEDELVTAGTPHKRSTAVILQELISALTAEQPISMDGHLSSQQKPKTKATSSGFACDGEHLSPGSVLEAPFSNDSCVSSSLDDSSGHRLQLDSMDYSQDQSQPAPPDTDLLDSATSWSKGSAGNQMVFNLINQISRLLHNINYVDLGLTGNKLRHATDVIANAELLFGNTSLHKSGGMKDFLVAPFLLDELEVLASAMQPKFNCLLGFESRKEGNQFRGFLFDCWIECFETQYGRYCNPGFKAWTSLPLRMNAAMLIREVGEEVIRWTHLAGMTPDQIIEGEMSHSLGKWTEFDIEAFETGAQIALDMLQILVEEIVIDIWECRLVSLSIS